MLCCGLLPVLLSSLVQLGSTQESGCAAAAPALLQADQRRVHRNLTEEANSSHASKAGNISKNHSISHKKAAKKKEEEKKEEAEEKKEEAKDDKEEEKEEADILHEAEEDAKKTKDGEDGGPAESAYDEVPNAKLKKNESKTSTGPPTMPPYTDIDMNKDGVLTPKEFQTKKAKLVMEIENAVKTIVKHEKQIEDSKLSLERKIDEMPAYEDLDRNTDGVVTPAEYRTSNDTAMAKNLSYEALDGNGDGAVTPGDFKNASEKWAAELTMQVEGKIKELASEREQRRKLEQDIDSMESYEDLDKQRDGVITRSEYGQAAKSAHGTWSVESHVAATKAPGTREAGAGASTKQVQKAGSTTTSVGFACLAVLVQAL